MPCVAVCQLLRVPTCDCASARGGVRGVSSVSRVALRVSVRGRGRGGLRLGAGLSRLTRDTDSRGPRGLSHSLSVSYIRQR